MKTFSRIRIILIAVLIVVFVFALVQMVQVFLDRKEAINMYEDLEEFVVTEETDPPETEPPEAESSEPGTEPAETVPKDEPKPIIKVDFMALQEKYPDVVGWLYCEGTPINYPVAKGKDNNQYLRHLLSGKYNTAGTLFADYRNAVIEHDDNFVIYGHNMKNGSMFGSLIKYKQQAYYDEHPVIYFLTPDRTYCVELLAGYVTSVTSDAYKLNYDSSELMDKYIENAIKKSTFKTNADYKLGDRLITFSTCSYEYTNARYVVVGRLTNHKELLN